MALKTNKSYLIDLIEFISVRQYFVEIDFYYELTSVSLEKLTFLFLNLEALIHIS